jgi:hypothetical protein
MGDACKDRTSSCAHLAHQLSGGEFRKEGDRWESKDGIYEVINGYSLLSLIQTMASLVGVREKRKLSAAAQSSQVCLLASETGSRGSTAACA